MAALECLRDKGYAATTARDLVEASGTNLASIGYHFGGKEELLNEAIARGMDAWTAIIEEEVFAESQAPAEERLRSALAAMIDRFDELGPYLRAFVEAFPPAVRSPELRQKMADAYARSRAAAGAMIARGLEENGVPAASRDTEALASLMLAVSDGLILQWLLDSESTPTSGEVIAALTAASSALVVE